MRYSSLSFFLYFFLFFLPFVYSVPPLVRCDDDDEGAAEHSLSLSLATPAKVVLVVVGGEFTLRVCVCVMAHQWALAGALIV